MSFETIGVKQKSIACLEHLCFLKILFTINIIQDIVYLTLVPWGTILLQPCYYLQDYLQVYLQVPH